MEAWIIHKAEKLGIDPGQTSNEVELIRMIQIKEGHAPCFGAEWCHLDRESDCCWKEFCKVGLFSI